MIAQTTHPKATIPRPAFGRIGVACRLLSVAASFFVLTTLAQADDRWNPFREKDEARAARQSKAVERPRAPPLPPMDGSEPGVLLNQTARQPEVRVAPAPPDGAPSRPEIQAGARAPGPSRASVGPIAGPIDRSELPPLQGGGVADAGPGQGSVWDGLDAARVELMMSKLDLPNGSPAAAALWRELLSHSALPPGADAAIFGAFRSERLIRAGVLDQARALTTSGSAETGAVAVIGQARSSIALGLAGEGCALAPELTRRRGEFKGAIGAEANLIAGYCAGIEGNRAAAGFAAELARSDGLSGSIRLAALEAFAQEVAATTPQTTTTLLDYQYLKLAGPIGPADLVGRADAGLRVAIARDATLDRGVRLLAAEAAAKQAALTAAELGDLYRTLGGDAPASETGSAGAALKRGEKFRAAAAERTPQNRARQIRALIDDARRAGLAWPMLTAVAPLVQDMQVVPEIGWFAETVIEALVAAHKPDEARRVLAVAERFDRPTGADGLSHWHALIDVSTPIAGRGAGHLEALPQLAVRGRFSNDLLHRLVTVLDALDVNVPLALWDAANRAPQPKSGTLPETGVLSELLEASKKKQIGRTQLLALRALGADGPEGAHLLALGDTIRALRRAGLEGDARRIATEALLPGWPRVTRF